MWPVFLGLDKKIFLLVNGGAGSWLDYALGWTTFLATPVLFAIVFLFIFIWDSKNPRRNFLKVLAGGMSGAIAANILKLLVDRPRPYEFFYDQIASGEVELHNMFNTYVARSFPSSHTALIFATVFALNAVYRQRLAFLYPLACIPSLSRIYVGAHFPSDVAGGVIIGVLGSFAGLELMKRFQFSKKSSAQSSGS